MAVNEARRGEARKPVLSATTPCYSAPVGSRCGQGQLQQMQCSLQEQRLAQQQLTELNTAALRIKKLMIKLAQCEKMYEDLQMRLIEQDEQATWIWTVTERTLRCTPVSCKRSCCYVRLAEAVWSGLDLLYLRGQHVARCRRNFSVAKHVLRC